jgi:hypothetical protein
VLTVVVIVAEVEQNINNSNSDLLPPPPPPTARLLVPMLEQPLLSRLTSIPFTFVAGAMAVSPVHIRTGTATELEVDNRLMLSPRSG